MLPVTSGRLPVGLLDARDLSDDALHRVARGASRVVALSTSNRSADDAARWSALHPDIPVEDGGAVHDLRGAIDACASRQVLVLATPAPRDAARFVGKALQGAADATQHGVPGVAVHVVRDRAVDGPVGWLSQSGAQSGYGVLFAMGYAELHNLPVVLVEPAGGLGDPRTPEARDEAMQLAERAGLTVESVSDPSPTERVLRDRFSVVVQPVLDAVGGHALLRRDELPKASVAEGNPAALVRLLEEFDGDVVAVLDGVRLLGGDSHALQVAAGMVLATVAATGIGIAVAPAAGAVGLGNGAGVTASVQQQTEAGVTISAAGHNGNGQATVHVVNRLDHPITIQLEVTWVHSGNHPPQVVQGAVVTVAAGSEGTFAVARPNAIGQGGYHVGGSNLVARGPGGPLLTIPTNPDGGVPGTVSSVPVPVNQLSPHFRPPVVTPPQPPTQQVPTPNPHVAPPKQEIVVPPMVVTGVPGPTIVGTGHVITGVPGPTITGHGQVPPVQPIVTPPEPIIEPPLPPMTNPPTLTPPQNPIVTPPEPIVEPPLQQVVTPPDPLVVDPPETGEVTGVTVTPTQLPPTTTRTPGSTTTPGTATTGTPELAHTGIDAQTGILAGLAAALLAAGAGLTVAARRGKEETAD